MFLFLNSETYKEMIHRSHYVHHVITRNSEACDNIDKQNIKNSNEFR